MTKRRKDYNTKKIQKRQKLERFKDSRTRIKDVKIQKTQK